MKKFISILSILFLFANNGCTTKTVKQDIQTETVCHVDVDSPSFSNPEEMLKTLREYADSNAPDAIIIQKMLDILEPVFRNEKGAIEKMPKLVDVLNESLDHYEKEGNTDNILCGYEDALGWISTLKQFGVKDESFAERVHKAVSLFPSRFPKTGKVMQVYALHLSLIDSKPEDVIAAYHECLEMDAFNRKCRLGYDRLVKDYTQLHCKRADISKGLEFYIGYPTGFYKYKREIKYENGKLFIAKEPALTSADIESLTPMTNEYGGEEISVVFTESAKEKLGLITENNINRPLAIVFKNKILTAPVIKTKIKDGIARITPGVMKKDGKQLFQQLCKKPTAPKLPKHLSFEG